MAAHFDVANAPSSWILQHASDSLQIKPEETSELASGWDIGSNSLTSLQFSDWCCQHQCT